MNLFVLKKGVCSSERAGEDATGSAAECERADRAGSLRAETGADTAVHSSAAEPGSDGWAAQPSLQDGHEAAFALCGCSAPCPASQPHASSAHTPPLLHPPTATPPRAQVVEGMRFDRGYISPYFITNPKNMKCELENPLVLLVEKKVSQLQALLPLLEAIVKTQRPLLIISEDVEGEVRRAATQRDARQRNAQRHPTQRNTTHSATQYNAQHAASPNTTRRYAMHATQMRRRATQRRARRRARRGWRREHGGAGGGDVCVESQMTSPQFRQRHSSIRTSPLRRRDLTRAGL